MSLPKPFSYALRLLVTVVAAYGAFSQVQLREVMPLLLSIEPGYLLVALLLIHAGQLISALRTRYYLDNEGIDFPIGASLRLHYVGGLFSAFLPGGMGGDAYKAWWLKRYKNGRMLDMVKLMIAGRLNGLWALGVIVCIMGLCSATLRNAVSYAPALLVAALVLGTGGYMLFARHVLREPLRQQLNAGLYSLGVQLAMAMVAFILWGGLGHAADGLSYVMLFMLSCILAMLPISIGGMGVRELALLHGSRILDLSEETGVTLAFAFTILNLTIPLIGAVLHHFHTPEDRGSSHDD